MLPNVSVVLTVRNVEKYISLCLISLLNQTVDDFEIIIVDDASTDSTETIIRQFSDKRIRYIRNKKLLGLSASRNISWSNALGELIFFTDGDCQVSPNWIEEGVKSLRIGNYVGVEGRTYYISKSYRPTRSDDIVRNEKGGLFNTCNIAYKKAVLQQIGGFDERFDFHEDRDLAERALHYGAIYFDKDLLVFHQKKTVTAKQFISRGKIIRNRVLIFKKLGVKINFIWRIVNPLDLVAIIVPPLIFSSLIMNDCKTKQDYDLIPYIYPKLIYERISLWKACLKEKVFLI